MTEKLFYQDSYLAEFEGRVLSCVYRENRYEAVLDRTAFFPEGGGQTSDKGSLGTGESFAQVTDVQEREGEVIHYIDREIPVGSLVKGQVDFKERFSKMQQHTGEHIISGIVNRRFGYQNVGFHLGSQEVTMDYDGPLTKEQLSQIEYEANRAVFENIPIQVLYPSREELEEIWYRSKMEIPGQVRIVRIPGYDSCACCAPHVKSTGNVGLIKITGAIRYKGGMRLWIQCGFRALMDYRGKEDSVVKLSNHLSARQEEVYEAVLRLEQETTAQKEKVKALQEQYVQGCLEQAKEKRKREPGGPLLLFVEELDPQAARNFVNQAMKMTEGISGVFTGREEEGAYSYTLGSPSLDIRELGKKLNARFSGKGGGRPPMIQGALQGRREEIEAFLEEAQKKRGAF